MFDRQKVSKWNRWIEQIETDIVQLLSSRMLYKCYGDIVRSNADVMNDGAFFHNWIVDNYVTYVSMAIRNQLDNDGDSISLVRLMRDIKDNPESLARNEYIALYISLPVDIATSEGNRCFNENAGEGDYIDPMIIESDLAILFEASKNISNLASRRVAHHSSRAVPSMTFDEVDSCIEIIKTIARKYILLLKASDNILEPITPEWRNIFTKKWIDE